MELKNYVTHTWLVGPLVFCSSLSQFASAFLL